MTGDSILRQLDVPVLADAVDSPSVSYGQGPASINFRTRDERWARVTFEKLDSIRVSRGEYPPYATDPKQEVPHGWVSVVSHSSWLRERCEYEKRHYGSAYMFDGDVDEMVRDFSHYVFAFHDEFVEAICAGIWFESANDFIGDRPPAANHPLVDLPASAVTDTIEAHGIVCRVWRNSAPLGDVIRDAALCSQKLLQFAPELDGSADAAWTLTIRVREGKLRSYLTGPLARVEEAFDGLASLADVRPRIELLMYDVRRRRDEMGKGA